MKKNLNLIVLFVCFILVFLTGSFYIYSVEKNNYNTQTVNELKKRHNLVKEYFQVANTFMYSLKNVFLTNYNLSSKNLYTHPKNSQIKSFTKKGTYHLDYKISNKYSSSLNGILNENFKSKQLKDEINAAFSLNPIFNTALNSFLNIQWIYYSSNNRFIYLSPTNFLMSKDFIKEQFKKEFWVYAIEKNNPLKKLALTNIYVDGAGKGLLMTLSLPIYNKDKFLGTVSIDFSLDTLNKLINQTSIQGNIYLINNRTHILSSNKYFKLGEKLLKDNNTYNYKELELLDEQLKIIYEIKKEDLKNEIIKQASLKILLLLFILSILALLVYLYILNIKIKNLATTDSLTHLLNRRSFMEKITVINEVSSRYEQNLSFLILDVDHFKKINDTYGHKIGDVCLVKISSIFMQLTRDADLVCRYGGEEFLICLPNTNLEEAFILGERIRKTIEETKISKYKINLTISIGCIEKRDDECLDSAINRADELLYKAKRLGRNQSQK